jgi:hypothetical protein
MDIGNVKDMIEELEKTALGFDDTRYGLLITASEMMTKLYQENERLREEVKASEQLCKIYFDIANQFLSESKIREVRDEKIRVFNMDDDDDEQHNDDQHIIRHT